MVELIVDFFSFLRKLRTSSRQHRHCLAVLIGSAPFFLLLLSDPFASVSWTAPPLLRNLDDSRNDPYPGPTPRINGQRKGYRFLTLGGATTWGSDLSSRSMQSYPALLGEMHPDNVASNLATKATDSLYTSTCIQSMARNAGVENDTFDVIVLEFSLTGIQGLRVLIRRLKQRYPHAVIIYVDLYSLENLRNSDETRTPRLIGMMEQFGGYVYSLPRPSDYTPHSEDGPSYDEVLEWFSEDRHHLNPRGHEMVAEAVMDIVREVQDEAIPDYPYKGTYGAGDTCHSWLTSGIPPPALTFEGGKMNEFDPEQHKFAFEVPHGAAGKISFGLEGDNDDDWLEIFLNKEDVYVTYMATGDPSLYPRSRLAVVPQDKEDDSINVKENEGTILDPKPTHPEHHLAKTSLVGSAMVGQKNSLFVEPIERTQYPMRIVAIMVCGACREMGKGALPTKVTSVT